MLGNTIKFDHGYGRDSPAVGHFLRLLAALDSPDQRRFLRFVTGSPRLPPGGLAALQVPLALHTTLPCDADASRPLANPVLHCQAAQRSRDSQREVCTLQVPPAAASPATALTFKHFLSERSINNEYVLLLSCSRG